MIAVNCFQWHCHIVSAQQTLANNEILFRQKKFKHSCVVKGRSQREGEKLNNWYSMNREFGFAKEGGQFFHWSMS